VVKSQTIDIIEVIGGLISGEMASKGRVVTGNQGVSWSQPPRLIGLPRNSVESEIFGDVVAIPLARTLLFYST
jgi:hypothetical protein